MDVKFYYRDLKPGDFIVGSQTSRLVVSVRHTMHGCTVFHIMNTVRLKEHPVYPRRSVIFYEANAFTDDEIKGKVIRRSLT